MNGLRRWFHSHLARLQDGQSCTPSRRERNHLRNREEKSSTRTKLEKLFMVVDAHSGPVQRKHYLMKVGGEGRSDEFPFT